MERTRKNWENAQPNDMVNEIVALSAKLKKKTEDLSRARFRLRKARVEISRLKEIVAYQRSRILELH
jgi:hypothetical protein